MRRFLLVVALASCASHTTSGPAWPQQAKVDATHEDGGESLAPHESRQIAVAIEKKPDDEGKPAAPESKPAAAAAAGPEVGAAPAAAAQAPVDETLTTEDIIIEIDD